MKFLTCIDWLDVPTHLACWDQHECRRSRDTSTQMGIRRRDWSAPHRRSNSKHDTVDNWLTASEMRWFVEQVW